MSFVAAMRQTRDILRDEKRLSLRALQRELGLENDAFRDLIGELVDFQHIAVCDGTSLVWAGEGPETPRSDEGERRQLSVLFCDLVGSTEIAHELDAEDWRDMLRTYQELANEVVGRFGGYVAQYLGDGILAYFGYPTAYEDDAERAVRAGLSIVDALENRNPEMLKRHGRALAVRVGIHTGEVVVGEVGSGKTKETLALGKTTHVAARLQQHADPNCVLMSGCTARLSSGIFVSEDLGRVELAGVAVPLRAFRAVHVAGMRSRIDVNSARELSPFIGRDNQLAKLERRFAELKNGRGRAVLISGEAGVGKSRLLQMFRSRIEGAPHSWLEVRGSTHTQDSAFYPVLDLQRDGLGFRSSDPPEVQLQALRAGLARMDFDVEELLPLLADFHGIRTPDTAAPKESPEAARIKLFELFSEWLSRLACTQPVVMVVEDLHWS
jgi:class 3 adenylate cyclase